MTDFIDSPAGTLLSFGQVNGRPTELSRAGLRFFRAAVRTENVWPEDFKRVVVLAARLPIVRPARALAGSV